MSNYYKSGSYSPNARSSNSPTYSSKKRLTFLLSKCLDMQLNVSATRKKIIKISSASAQRLKLLETELNKKPSEYTQNKKPFSARSTNLSPVSEVHKKIVSLLEPVLKAEKFVLSRSPCQKIAVEYNKDLITVEELNNPEAKELLKLNKRKFGQHFNIDQKDSNDAKLVSPRGKPPRLNGYYSKNIQKIERNELIRAYLKEKNDIGGKVLMQKMIHENLKRT